ncbi:hypothetical protein MtrunA17_Chr5g0433981 [Medicago truncatula]|uniref:Uncharacterized protein n=1 Tax=Medicago truncatula TaxID=3880 RepID=A0A396HZL6_MEDTR|nr:hypothetical protein MtrunA17_Chr5g0433981 [Medicago truncatula]
MGPTPLQSAMLMGSPCFPNAISWSDDNLIAVASAHFVTILVCTFPLCFRPDMPNGPRGLIKVLPRQPLILGFLQRQGTHLFVTLVQRIYKQPVFLLIFTK